MPAAHQGDGVHRKDVHLGTTAAVGRWHQLRTTSTDDHFSASASQASESQAKPPCQLQAPRLTRWKSGAACSQMSSPFSRISANATQIVSNLRSD